MGILRPGFKCLFVHNVLSQLYSKKTENKINAPFLHPSSVTLGSSLNLHSFSIFPQIQKMSIEHLSPATTLNLMDLIQTQT